MTCKRIEGVLPLTPLALKENQEIDYDGIKRNIELLADNGINGFIAFGSMGQHFAVTESEFNRVVDVSIDAAKANQICVIGATAPNTKESIRRATYAEDRGADACMIAPTYTYPLNHDWVFKHYKAVNDALKGDAGIVVYNWPPGYRINITAEVWDRLLQLENIRALKESSEDILHRNRILLKLANKISVIAGNEEWWWTDSFLGANGICGIVTWGAPKVILRFYEECRKGNQLKPWTLDVYKKLIQLGPGRGMDPSLNLSMYGPAILNTLVEAGGGRAGPLRMPLERLPEKDRLALVKFVEDLRGVS
jgi:dihydrodipicolinate synthase/N-acetylneuraminate lyase